MTHGFATESERDTKPVPLVPLTADGLAAWREQASPRDRRWQESAGFAAKAGEVLVLPGEDGGLERCLFGMQPEGCLYQLASVQDRLPPVTYVLECDWSEEQQAQACLGWGLGAYRYERYRRDESPRPNLYLDPSLRERVTRLCAAQSLVRDLVNTPTEHLGPEQLADAAVSEADRFDAHSRVIVGDELLSEDFPAVHAVGRAASRAPRLIELDWGDEDAPLLALVGKGVCFDTGGLDLKNASGMALMKKDMGGAAHALALAQLVMAHALPVRLKLLIPAVENSVSGNAYRPGDVIATRKGLSVEIGNTDAEGRVVLSDALALACESRPDLVIDFATLTGAARVALGTDLPALFSNRDEVSSGIQQAGTDCEDPLWTLPLYAPYNELIKSPIADITNNAKTGFGGAITAALFLQRFVEPGIPWVHIDTYAWNSGNRAGRPEGGEALGLRAVFHYLRQRYS
ncbi:leucyl aminopeptidase family protein [Elongatibacter sediminis]|uniref:Leucyl aminopeptidase family protein n=1 Tax=Elongatibacter sediminis TaxID=3119006 RepID=A0AAW9RFD2_9GAMM